MLYARKLGREAVSLGVPITINLDRNYAFREILLRLAGSITIAGGSTSGTPKDSTPMQLISSVEILRNGKDTIFKLSAEELHRLNQIFYGTRPSISGLANGDAQSNTAVNGEIRIPFVNLRGIKPIDTLLKARGLTSLQLLIEIASAASVLIEGGDRTIAVGSTPFTLDTVTVEEVGLEDFIFGDIRKRLVSSATITATSSEFQIKPIPVGNEWKGFILVAKDGNLLSNAIINNIKIRSGTEVFVNVDATQLREANKAQFSLETFPTGYYVLDFMPDGLLNQILDVRRGTGRESLEFSLDVTVGSGTTVVDVIGLEYIRPETFN